MKLSSNVNGEAFLFVPTGRHYTAFVVPMDKPQNWYPFNPRYKYRYSKARDRLYIIGQGHTLEASKYPWDNEKVNRAKSSKGVCSKYTWNNPDVKKENEKVMDYCEAILGIHTPRDNYTEKQVIADTRKVCEYISQNTDQIVERYRETNKVYGLCVDDIIEAEATEVEDHVYHMLGCALTMLSVMRKALESGGN